MLDPPFIWLILGKRGKGKTTLAHKIIRKIKAHFDIVIVFDSLLEYKLDDFETIYGIKELQNYVSENKGKKSRIYLIYRPHYEDGLALDEEFETISNFIWRIENQKTLFVVDEIDRFASTWSVVPEFSKLIEFGRHKNISLIGISRRLPRVNRNFSANADKLFLFQLHNKADLKELEFLGVDSDAVKNLADFKFLELDI